MELLLVTGVEPFEESSWTVQEVVDRLHKLSASESDFFSEYSEDETFHAQVLTTKVDCDIMFLNEVNELIGYMDMRFYMVPKF